jgi:hypothetical protein
MANEEIKEGPWAGFTLIHSYTRKQAIDDGVLVDVTELAKASGFVVPVAMTAAVFADVEHWADMVTRAGAKTTSNDLVKVVLRFTFQAIRKVVGTDTDRVPLPLTQFVGRPQSAIAVIGPGDNAEPVVTLLYPGEE